MPALEIFFNYPIEGASSQLPVTFSGSELSDKAIELVEAAESTIDLAAYNFDHSPLASALRRAHSRGVRVRVVTDIDTQHPSLLSPTPEYFWIAVNDEGLMHHKFLVIDADSSEKATVMTGSTNFTDANIYGFYNESLVIRSGVLAKAYQQEFELLWGSNTAVPSGSRSRSGAGKPNRMISSFTAGPITGDVYFSPNDEVSTRIVSELDSAQESVAFQLLVLTYEEIGMALQRAQNRGIEVFGVVENYDAPSSLYNLLLSQGIDIAAHFPNEVVHHKYGVIDAERGEDAVIITGSHNWTYSAETFHDENTLVMTGSGALAELYHRAARDRHCALAGNTNCQTIVSSTEAVAKALDITIGPNPTQGNLTITLAPNQEQGISAFRILDNAGRLVQGGITDNYARSLSLQLAHLSPASYILQLRSEEGWDAGHFFIIQR